MIIKEIAGYQLSEQGETQYRQYVLKGGFLPLENIYHGTTGEMQYMKQKQLDRVLGKAIAESQKVYVASYIRYTACPDENNLHPKAERKESAYLSASGMWVARRRGGNIWSDACTLILCEPMYSQTMEDQLVSQFSGDWKELHVIQLVCENTLEQTILDARKTTDTITQKVWEELLAQEVKKLEPTKEKEPENPEIKGTFQEALPDKTAAYQHSLEYKGELSQTRQEVVQLLEQHYEARLEESTPKEVPENLSPAPEGKTDSKIRDEKKVWKSLEQNLVLAMAITIAGSLLTPKTGAYALWNVLFTNLIVLAASLYGITVLYKKEGKGILVYGAAVLLLVLNIGINKNLVLDAVHGPQTVTLTNARYHSSSSPLIHIGTKYYLSGVDSEGQNLSMLLDEAHYQAENWEHGQTRVIKCYKNTGRLYGGPY